MTPSAFADVSAASRKPLFSGVTVLLASGFGLQLLAVAPPRLKQVVYLAV
jgi:hypothetical protein